MSDILRFQGENRYLSNFYLTDIIYKSKVYGSSEHLYQSLKMKNPDDAEKVRTAFSAGRAKTLGGSLPMRDNFDEIKFDIMYYVVKLKFTGNVDLMEKLINTGDAFLEEGNTWHDNYWGNCSCSKCARKPKLNNLGRILMIVRQELRERYALNI